MDAGHPTDPAHPADPADPTDRTASHPSVGEGLEHVVAAALADLAERLGVDPADVTVVEARAVTWPDGGLGCRRPGMRYKQVPVDGSRTVLEHAGRRYAYHTGGRTAVPFLCEHPG